MILEMKQMESKRTRSPGATTADYAAFKYAEYTLIDLSPQP